MNIGVCRIKFRLPENMSLKGKRGVLKSITNKLRNKFNVSVAEIDDQDFWQVATFGVCYLSNDSRYTNTVLSKVVNLVTNCHLGIEILNYEIEIIHL